MIDRQAGQSTEGFVYVDRAGGSDLRTIARRSMRRLLIAVAVWLLVLCPIAQANRDVVVREVSGRAKGTVLLAHPGALVYGSARAYLPRAHPFAQAGYRVRVVDYPLGNYPGAKRAMSRAIREVRQQRGEGHKVYLVGESTGGTLVQDAAVRHRVRKAVAIAPVSDFTTWAAVPHEAYPLVLRMDARRASPIYYRGKPRTQVTVFHSRDDDIVPFEQSVRYTRRKGGLLRELSGGHLADQSWIPRVIRSFNRDLR